MQQVISSKVPKFDRLPTTITDTAVSHATLPIKIEAARRAIAECTELPELLRYKDYAEGIAAAVRTMKHVGPEMIRKANEMMADAWRKGGELLSQYSGASKSLIVSGKCGTSGSLKSSRHAIANQLGLRRREAVAMVRLYRAPVKAAYKAAQSTKNLNMASLLVPVTGAGNRGGGAMRSDACRNIMGGWGGGKKGLISAMSIIRCIDLSNFKQLAPDERKMVKAKITEVAELLDEMDRLCR